MVIGEKYTLDTLMRNIMKGLASPYSLFSTSQITAFDNLTSGRNLLMKYKTQNVEVKEKG